jgi:hypothetical protein
MKTSMFAARLRRLSGFGVTLILTCAVVASFSLAKRKASPAAATATHEPASATAKNKPSHSKFAHEYGALPLSFEANQCQTDSAVRFVSRGAGYTLFLTQNEAIVSLQKQDETPLALRKMKPARRKLVESRKYYRGSQRYRRSRKTETIRVAMVGVNPAATVSALDELPGKSNYFVGNDPKNWRTGISTFEKVKYSEIYPGIDLVYYGKQRQLEFDFVVAPGADPEKIALKIQTDGQLAISKNGSLRIESKDSSFELRRPDVYQLENGKRRLVAGRFVLRGDDSVGFELGKYDHRERLIIDPALAYSTYLGGNGSDDLFGIAVDTSGNAYVVGQTTSTNFPTANAYSSTSNANGIAFVSKLNANGTALLYSTYLGGTGGESGNGIALDPSGNVYVTGFTQSTDFPVVNAFQTTLASPDGNAFVSRIDTTQSGTASLVYSTYLGGGSNSIDPFGDTGFAIAADASGLAYVTGTTTSDSSVTPFPTTASAYQSTLANQLGNAFLTALDTTQSGMASLIYSTYLGGSSSSQGDIGLAVAIDGAGNAYLAGATTSDSPAPFPTTASAYQTSLSNSYDDVFVSEIATTQSGPSSLVYSTYFGGSGDSSDGSGDVALGIALDAAGKVYVTGAASSSDFPITSGAYQTTNPNNSRAFVSKFDMAQSGAASLVYSTYLGGSNGDEGRGIAVDASGNAYIGGGTQSSDFPTTTGAIQTALNSSFSDPFLTVLNSAGTGLNYSTYLGGSCADGDVANSIAVDSDGNPYLAGNTCSTDFPTYPSTAFQTSLAGTQNAFITKLALQGGPPTITNLSTNQEGVGGPVIITGTNFGSIQGTSSLTFNGILASPTSWNSTTITVSVPDGATTGSLIVAVAGVASNAVNFTVLPTPSITGLSSSSGPVGLAVTIAGGAFGTSQGTSTVTFNSVAATPTSWSATNITAPVPMGATSGSVVVTVNGVPSNPASFTVRFLASITVYPQSSSIPVGGTQQFTAIGIFTDNTSEDLTSVSTWTSSNPSVATVSTTGLVSDIAVGQTIIQAAVGSVSQSFALTASTPSFALTGSLNTPRHSHTATVLTNGKVLIAGGSEANVGDLASAELYDPSTGTYSTTGSLSATRTKHTATLLNTGKVLIVGGSGANSATAELYDPATGTFATTGSLPSSLVFHTATLLNNGKVLVAGGLDGNYNATNAAEVYDPVTGVFSPTGSLNSGRFSHVAALLSSGKVLIAGGEDINENVFSSAELYDPTAGTFSTTGNLVTARINHTATTLGNGMVLIAGGLQDSQFGDSSSLTTSAELYNPSTGAFAATGALGSGRDNPTATLLGNGLVLIAGGAGWEMNFATAELYYPSTGTFAFTGAMNVYHVSHTASLLQDGAVLVAGGAGPYSSNGEAGTCELYQPTTLTGPPTISSIAVSPLSPSIILGKTQAFTATGVFSDGTAQDMTSRATWTSSVPGVATINSAGLATSVSPDGTTITAASAGSSASTVMTVIPVVLVSIAINPQYPTVVMGSSQQFSAIGTYNDGSTQNLTSSVVWSSTAPGIATINASGLAQGVGVGTTSIHASLGPVQVSTPFYVVAQLESLSVTPTSSQIPIGGTVQLSAIGTYSSGSVNLNSLSSWTTTNANVATVVNGLVRGASSGAATITATYVYFSTTLTASATITVTTQYAPPQISASIYPASSSGTWTHQNTVVTFVCTAGGLPIAGCTSPQTITTEGTNQVVTGTVTDTAGTAVTTSVTLNIDKTPPSLTLTSPSDGSTFTTPAITVTGTASDGLSGLLPVLCNSQGATMSGANFSCNLTLSVGVNVIAVKAFDAAGNVSTVILHEALTGTLPKPNSLQVTPGGVNILVGDTQQFTAVDDLGRPRSEASWTVSDTSIATITTNSSPILTAVAAGQVTLTSTVQGVSSQTQVTVSTSLASGAIRWSVPSASGFAPLQIVQAVPTSTGPSLYSVQSNGPTSAVQAFTSDGQQMWQTVLPIVNANSVPDGFGGLLLTIYNTCDNEDPMQIIDLDGPTGTPLWQVTGQSACTVDPPQLAIRSDGAVILAASGNTSGFPELTILDGRSGQPISFPQIPLSTYTDGFGDTLTGYTPIGPAIVDSDGSTYVEYEVRTIIYPPKVVSAVVSLLKVSLDGSTTTTQLSSTSEDKNLFPGSIIPDGQGGVLATWSIVPGPVWAPPPDHPYQAAHVSSGAASPYNMPVPVAPQKVIAGVNGLPIYLPMVLGENGTAFVSYGLDALSFNLTSGGVNWDYQTSQGISGIFYGNGGVVTLIDTQSNQIPIDASGNAGSSIALSSMGLLQPSWTGTWQGALGASGTASVSAALMDWGHSFWAAQGGSPSPSGASTELPWYPPLQSCPSAQTPCAGDAVWNAVKSLKTLTAGSCLACNTYVFGKLGKSQQGFNALLNLPPLLSDGTRSYAPMNHVMCDWWNIFCPFGNVTVARYMTDHESSAISRTPSPNGIVTFVYPGSVCVAGTAPGTLLNESLMFHEALHGYTGLIDSQLENMLNVSNVDLYGSTAISYYLENKVFGATLMYHDPGGNVPLLCQN